MSKPILIPLVSMAYPIRGGDPLVVRFHRIFNPAHIVSIEPVPDRDDKPLLPFDVVGYLYTSDGRQHSIPRDSYHTAFVEVQQALTTE